MNSREQGSIYMGGSVGKKGNLFNYVSILNNNNNKDKIYVLNFNKSKEKSSAAF